MDNFIYQNPVKILFGKGVNRQIGEEIRNKGFRKVFVLYGGGSVKKNGVYEEVTESLDEAGLEFEEFWGVQPNPVATHAREALKAARKFQSDCILAVGGGSVIDEAKAISAGFEAEDVWDVFEKKAEVSDKLPLFTVLTLSATGSEMNAFSVLTNEAEQKKWAIGGKPLYPVVSVIDPSVQMTLPQRQTINGAVDSLSHVMELYFRGKDEEVVLGINESLMKSIIKSTDILLANKNDYNARAALAWAAALALNGLTGISMRGGEWSVHKIEHSVSALFPEVAHAEGLAVLFPAWIKYCQAENSAIFERWAKNIWDSGSVEEAVNKMKLKFKQWNAPVCLGGLGIGRENIESIADNAMMTGEFGNLKRLCREDVINILKLSL